MLLLNVSSQREGVPDEFLSTALDLTDVNLLLLEDASMIFSIYVLRQAVLSLNVSDELRPELELLLAHLAAKNASVQPLNLLSLKSTHELLLVVIQAHFVALGDMLVEGEVVTQNTVIRSRLLG